MDFFYDGRVFLSDFPDKKFPFKTDLSKQERKPVKKRYPEPGGRHIVLILTYPSQNDRLQNAAIYQFPISCKEPGIRPVIAEKPVKFSRVSSARHE